jgi:hypothetical protein
VSNKNKNMANHQSAVKEQVSKKLQKSKAKVRILKNIINKPRNDFPEIATGEVFVLADGFETILKLTKTDGQIVVSEKMPKNIKGIKIKNLFTGFDIWNDTENQDDIKLLQITKNDVELCRITIGGGVIASIKKSDIAAVLEAWVE